MAVALHRPAKVSYLIRQPLEGSHRLGVNALAVHDATQRVITAGRDADVRVWSVAEGSPRCVATAEGHADWVNDVVVTSDGENVVSCSNDTTVRIWRCNADGADLEPAETLWCHTDYARCLAYAAGAQAVVSAGKDPPCRCRTDCVCWVFADCDSRVTGLDQRLNVIDLARGEVIRSECFDTKKDRDARSIYSVTADHSMRLVATGSPDKVIRLYDVRSGEVVAEMKGHTENVRALHLDLDASTCLSGGSDGSLRVWDVRQRSCLLSKRYHSDSVWAIAASPEERVVVTGGRDGRVFRFDPSRGEATQVLEGLGPVSSLALAGSSHVWLSANPKSPSTPIVARWRLPESGPAGTDPDGSIPIGPGVVKCQTLNDRQRILSQDSQGGVSEWRVGTASLLQDHGKADFDATVQRLTKMVSIPSWFSAVPCAGGLKVTLEKSTVFSAEIPAADVVVDSEAQGTVETLVEEGEAINLGGGVTRALFQGWLAAQDEPPPATPAPKEEYRRGGGHRGSTSRPAAVVRGPVPPDVYRDMPGRTVVTVVPGGASTPSLIKRVGDLDGSEKVGHVPDWVADCLTLGPVRPKEVRITFKIVPLEGSGLAPFDGPAQLTAPTTLVMAKTYKYLAGKLGQDVDVDQPPEAVCDLFCNGKLVPPALTIAAVQECLWRNRPIEEGQDHTLVLEYDVHPPPPSQAPSRGRGAPE